MLTTSSAGLLLIASLACFGACSGGGGSDSPAPELAASVPAGSGSIAISMVGTWQVSNATVVDSNASAPLPPPNGTTFVIEADRVASIGGLSVDPDGLAILLGAPLESYVNQVNGRTIFYGVAVDRRSANGTRDEVAVAGGALDADTIAVEAYTSSQSGNAAEATYTVSRYQLVRVAPTTPLQLADEQRAPVDVFREAFGR